MPSISLNLVWEQSLRHMLSIEFVGAILDELRAQDWVPRSIRRKRKLIEKSISKLEGNLGRKATPKIFLMI